MTRPPREVIVDACDLAGVGGRRMAVRTIERPTAGETVIALVRLAQRGDPAAFDRLAGARIDRAYRLAVAILRSEADARDAVQDAFVAAWRELPRLRDPGRFDPWLDRIVLNQCRMALRHRRVVRVREIEVADPGAALGATEQVGEEPAEEVADADLVRRALEHLDVDRRSILVLHHVEDRSIDEIGVILQIPAGTVKWRLHVARAALARALEEESR